MIQNGSFKWIYIERLIVYKSKNEVKYAYK